MAVSTIIAIPAHAQANSYITRAEANVYFADRDNSAVWTGATDDQKDQSLIEATRLIDALRFHNFKLKDWQRLEFPRSDTDTFNSSPDSATNVGNGTIIDTDLKNKIAMPQDYWNNGAMWWTQEGDNNFMLWYLVTDFDFATGTVTISGTFAATPTTSDDYELIREIPPEVKWSACETALAIIDDLIAAVNTSNIKSQALDTERVEYFGKSSQTVELPTKAMQLLKPYISKSGQLITTPKFR